MQRENYSENDISVNDLFNLRHINLIEIKKKRRKKLTDTFSLEWEGSLETATYSSSTNFIMFSKDLLSNSVGYDSDL